MPTSKLPPDSILVVGMDPSMSNWGLAKGILHLPTMKLDVVELAVIQPVKPEGKQVRNNSKDLASAQQLAAGAVAFVQGARAIFVEVPHGSQSARAMASYGLCVGVLGAMRAHGYPLFELNEAEVKAAALPGVKKPTKADMINWATQQHPGDIWPLYQQNGATFKKGELDLGRAEHMADAIGAIRAGLTNTTFQQLLSLMRMAQP